MRDEAYMGTALELARQAEGWTSPNPMVGAVIVRDGKIVGHGFHRQAGTPHAEVHALQMAGDQAKGATLYVTLEPCSHYGRTPPCVNAILEAKVARVVAAMKDPNPKVDGGGLNRLRQEGVEVTTGVLENEARLLNEIFIKYITARLPFVAIKSAVTLDGKIATRTGSSRWITGEEARISAHRLRHKHDAIMVGIGTVLADNPQLTVRIPGEKLKNPIRVIIDSSLRIPLNAKVLNVNDAPVIIYTAGFASSGKAAELKGKGVEVVDYADALGKVDLVSALHDLASRGITGVMAEGGAGINGSLLDRHLVDKMYVYVAPKLVGSHLAPGLYGGTGVAEMKDAVALEKTQVETLGRDILITGYPVYKEAAQCSPDSWKN